MEDFKGVRRFFYNFSNAGQALFDTLINTFYAIFLIPPKEMLDKGMVQFLSEKTYFGFFTIVGLIMLFGRVIDAFVDPLVATTSDRSKSRLGRRRQFLIFGGVPLALSAVLFFFPPVHATSYLNAIYLAVVFGIFYISYSMYVAPYIALIPELGHNEKQRIDITTVQAYFALGGGAIALLGVPLLLDFFKGAGPIQAYQIMAIIMGIIGVVFLYFAVFAVDEKRFSNAKPSSMPILQSLSKTFRNKSFIAFLFANMCFWFIFNTVRSSVVHIATTILKGDDTLSFLCFAIMLGSGVVFFLVTGILAKKMGKKPIYLIGLGSMAVVAALIGITGLLPIDAKIWGIACFALMGIPVSIFLTLPNVFISEVCDQDLKATGEHREAIYFGVHGFFQKLTVCLSAVVLAYFFLAFGKDVANPTGVRLTILASSAVAAIGFFVFLFAPVFNEKKE
jgi:GPH family glycoside/pentoside/hexuronide:cation symporter